MIVAIADDMTGAAEIGGMGWAHGLSVSIGFEMPSNPTVELIVLAANTRALSISEAREKVYKMVQSVATHHPELLYKKIDSVLRGHVMEEADVFAKAQELNKVLLIPANPELGRTIVNGTYFLDDKPLSEHYFLKNGDHSSSVLHLVSKEYLQQTSSVRVGTKIDGPGYYIGDAGHPSDIEAWASSHDKKTALCGGADFFGALLRRLGHNRREPFSGPSDLGEKQLFVFGSTYHLPGTIRRQATENGFCLTNMPIEIYKNPHFSPSHMDAWCQEILNAYQSHDVVAITIHHSGMSPDTTGHLQKALGTLISSVISPLRLEEIFVEGGTTSRTVIEQLRIDEMIPIQVLARGVTRMMIPKYPNLHLTLKPGSYLWPAQVWPRQEKSNAVRSQ